ncbi:DUF1643 domain-containing protein [Ulvibacterium sp.]|uniref:DUF1643 domain-containing protein n=1 Tax=Ulvibacterium sp. TaxID=2665914 RepID=UPI002612FE8C|nr:DUF1643 domain-containing protein [Ulvibacterium sp.]
MKPSREVICFPEKDSKKRFVLGKPGKRNLLCVGINPNTADGERLDPTSRNVEKIALNNGYDGWILVNLYPRRTKKVAFLETKPDRKLFWENLKLIQSLVSKNQFKFNKIWLAWGNDIDAQHLTYLKDSAYHLCTTLQEFDLDFVSVGTNNSGHPTHPSPQALAQKFGKKSKDVKFTYFDARNYTEKIRKAIKVNSKIRIDNIDS